MSNYDISVHLDHSEENNIWHASLIQVITDKRRTLFGVPGNAYSLFLFSLCVSGELVASGQHRVQRSWPAGPAAAWQGMTLITALFLSVDCQPALSALHHPCVALYTIIQLGIPSWPGFNNNINYCRCPPWLAKFLCTFLYQVFVKEGTLMKVSRKNRQPRHLFLVNSASCLLYISW